jgi:hypothetical protein
MTIVKFKKSRRQCRAIMGVREFGIIVREHHCMLPIHHEGPHRGGGLIWGATAQEMMEAAEAAEPKKRILII